MELFAVCLVAYCYIFTYFIYRYSCISCVWFQALFSYVDECGYPAEQFELVTTFPRRNISHLDPACTLRDCSLYPQDTVFIQERSVWYALSKLYCGCVGGNIVSRRYRILLGGQGFEFCMKWLTPNRPSSRKMVGVSF